ncbi:hypothetical protein D3C78_1711810 [compost metagenome]
MSGGSLVAVDVLGIEGGLKAARIGPRLEVGQGVHHSPAELVKARPAADHPLLLQSARRKAQESCCFVIGEITRGRGGLRHLRCVIARSRVHGVRRGTSLAMHRGVEVDEARVTGDIG